MRSHNSDQPSRRAFLTATPAGIALSAAALAGRCAEVDITVASPDGNVRFQLLKQGDAGLRYQMLFKKQSVIEPSALGIIVDGTNLATGAEVGTVEEYRIDEKYPTNGGHAEAVNRCKGAKISIQHLASKTA